MAAVMMSGCWSATDSGQGRETETGAAQAWVDLLVDGPAALVVRGDPGIGKDPASGPPPPMLATAAGALVLVSRPVRARGVPLGYAGLGDLLEPEVGDRVSRRADRATGRRPRRSTAAEGPEPRRPEPLVMARAALAALRELAADSPVVVAVDDGRVARPGLRPRAGVRRAVGWTDRTGRGVLLALRADAAADPFNCGAALGSAALRSRCGRSASGPRRTC